jgi:hypothetical protein
MHGVRRELIKEQAESLARINLKEMKNLKCKKE